MTRMQRHGLILLTNLVAVLFLLLATATDRADSYAQLLENTRLLEAVESQLERDTERIRSLSLRSFDTLVTGRRDRDTALASLATGIARVEANGLGATLERAEAENAKSDMLLDQLTRSASQLNNARAALPAFTMALIDELETKPDTGPIVNALAEMLEAVALFALNPTIGATQRVDAVLADLSNMDSAAALAGLRRPSDFRQALTIAEIVLDETAQLQLLADSYISRDMPGIYDRLYDEIAVFRDREVAHLQRTVPLLDMLLLVLLAHAAYLLVSLIGANRRLEMYADDLAQNLDRERRMSEQQRRFVSTVSHEFRTPLTIIDTFAQRVLRRPERANQDALRDGFTSTRAAVRRLVHLMETTLNVNRLHDEGLNLKLERIDLPQLIQNISQYHQSETVQHVFEVDVDGLLSDYLGDPRLLQHVFMNTIGNAVKYAPEGGTVKVTGKREEDEIVVRIADSGIGIPEAEAEKLFTQYFRASNTTSIGGTGVSLHLTKEIVERHGGSVSVSSIENEGATVTIRLPAQPQADQSKNNQPATEPTV